MWALEPKPTELQKQPAGPELGALPLGWGVSRMALSASVHSCGQPVRAACICLIDEKEKKHWNKHVDPFPPQPMQWPILFHHAEHETRSSKQHRYVCYGW
ncbi:hypothetical protein JZ751_007207 [Albula glossodonta]|uniref:Uncharacterized protein n=1 Tax=Albula glossodonta TaxID=121402 RepID=A0A8T2PBG9_9TELE|nr:hypothetical protein JZ751_007207 [Albula glossodonta]